MREASFYGDSQVFTVSGLSNALFIATISATDKPLYPVDTDGDGLSDSVELSLGSDPRMVDSDGDGLTDADEHVAGSDALDQDSYPRITSMTDLGGGRFRLTWWPSVADRTYRVDCSTNLCQGGYSNSPSPSYASTGVGDSMVISDELLSETASFVLRISKEGNSGQ